MFGWLADSFRFASGLLYWNARKSWFRLRRGQVRCPCQSPSDSGRALDTRCDACVTWNRPERFRRVCPLLVPTDEGLRCSVDTPNVRPFWSRAAAWYGGAALALYAAAVVVVFGFLRFVGYPVSIVQVSLPPLWSQLGQARGAFFLQRSQRAFAAGRTNEGLLYLTNAYEFAPENYNTGLSLAKAYQIGQPARSDEIFARLLRDHPRHRAFTGQQWVLALISRGDFKGAATLASSELQGDPPRANAWMRALLFATARTGNPAPLEQLLAAHTPATRPWTPLLKAELALRAHHTAEAQTLVEQPWPADAPAFSIVYRVETLVELGHPVAALDLLVEYRSRLDDEAYLTERLHCLAAAGAERILRQEFQRYLLDPPLTEPALKVMCAQLIRHPDPALFAAVYAKVAREPMPFRDDTAGGWFSLVCTAGAVGDTARLHAILVQLRQMSRAPFAGLVMAEAFFRNRAPDARATSFLPYLPVPLEVMYALIERYPGGRVAVPAVTS